jgi:hypothetical protein
MSVRHRLRKSEAGAAIVENLVATTLLGTALVFLLGSYSTLAISSRTAASVAEAQTFARGQAARIKAAPYRDDADYTAYYDTVPTGMVRTVSTEWWHSNNFSGGQDPGGMEKIAIVVTRSGDEIARVEFVKANR